MIKSLLKGERKGASKRLLCLNARLKISNPCEYLTSRVCDPLFTDFSGCLTACADEMLNRGTEGRSIMLVEAMA
jgi:hypothetical protein